MIGSPGMIVLNFALCAYAIFAACIALAGYWQGTVSIPRRILLALFAAVILWPTAIWINLCGVVDLTILLFPDIRKSVQKYREKRAARHAAD